jgi:hypothetical protein
MNTINLRCCLSECDEKYLPQAVASAVMGLPAGSLPLHAGCTQGGWVDDSALAVNVLELRSDAQRIEARVGVFFTELVGGCNCHDDLVKVNAYSVLEVHIERISGQAVIEPDAR